ncbi:MAG: small, acid-soluble spore protein, alpha/beta type [Clostridia bacterium]|nr:small, acid-soluble spore protein, alpha/beta type [Clostridia bacterium]
MVENIDQILKNQAVEELGLVDKIKSVGWSGLSPKETGRVGGLIAKKKRLLKAGKSIEA